MAAEKKFPVSRTWRMSDDTFIEQRVEVLEVTLVVESTIERSEAESLLLKMIDDRLIEADAEPAHYVEIQWGPVLPLILGTTLAGMTSHPEVFSVTAVAHYFSKVVF